MPRRYVSEKKNTVLTWHILILHSTAIPQVPYVEALGPGQIGPPHLPLVIAARSYYMTVYGVTLFLEPRPRI